MAAEREVNKVLEVTEIEVVEAEVGLELVLEAVGVATLTQRPQRPKAVAVVLMEKGRENETVVREA